MITNDRKGTCPNGTLCTHVRSCEQTAPRRRRASARFLLVEWHTRLFERSLPCIRGRVFGRTGRPRFGASVLLARRYTRCSVGARSSWAFVSLSRERECVRLFVGTQRYSCKTAFFALLIRSFPFFLLCDEEIRRKGRRIHKEDDVSSSFLVVLSRFLRFLFLLPKKTDQKSRHSALTHVPPTASTAYR